MMPNPPDGQGPMDPRGAFSPPPPPPPQRWGFSRAVFVTLATTIFGMSLAANVYLLLLVGFTRSEAGTRSNVVIPGDPAQKVAVIPIDGVIDGEAYERFDRMVRLIEKDSTVKALVLEVDTPGGEVTASDEIYHRILRLKEEKGIPVVCSMGSLATSGGYYVACASDEVIARPTTLTGNIGVVLMRFDLSGTLEKWGARETSITPDGSTFKNAESMFKPDTPEVREYLKGIANDTYAQFKQVVKAGREQQIRSAGTTLEAVSDGRVYTANDALKLGLIDRVGYASDAYDRAASLAKLSKMHVVRYEQQPSFFESLGVSSGLRPATGGGGGINIKIDPSNAIRQITTPRLMYLWRGE